MQYKILCLLVTLAYGATAQRLFSIPIQGQNRSYWLYSPRDNYVDGAATFIVLHKNQSTARQSWGSRERWDALSKPAFLVFPQAVNDQWRCEEIAGETSSSDVAFLSTIINTFSEHFSVAEQNIHVLYSDHHECIVTSLRTAFPLIRFIRTERVSVGHDASVVEQNNFTTFVKRDERPTLKTFSTYFKSKEDSTNFIKGIYLPSWDFRFGIQAPLQLFGAIDVAAFDRGTFSISYGKLFRPFVNLAIERTRQRTGADLEKLAFFSDHYNGGRIWSLAGRYHFRRFYTGASVQFLKLGMKTTAQTIVHTLSPEKADEIEDKIDQAGYKRLREFYEQNEIRPAVFNTQLGLIAGYRLPMPFLPRLSISSEVGLYFVIRSRGKLDTGGGIISNALNRLVQDEIDDRLTDRFDGLKIPSLSMSIGYSFGYRTRE